MKIAVVAPSCSLKREAADRVAALVDARGDCELAFHPQCFLSDGHFAGSGRERLACAAPSDCRHGGQCSVVRAWGLGSNRLPRRRLATCGGGAGPIPLGVQRFRFPARRAAQGPAPCGLGPMPQDVLRDGGEAAITRALDWLVRRDAASARGDIKAPPLRSTDGAGELLGPSLEPDLGGAD